MKNLLIYISPNNKLNQEHQKMLEVQIENSLDYWAREDILIATNFPCEYDGIKAIEVPDLINEQFFENPRAIINSKIDTIIYLLENKFITESTWFHDFDAFQLAPFNPDFKDIGLVQYGIYPQNRLQPLGDYSVRVNCGSIFFRPESLDIFKDLLERMNRAKRYEEDELTIMYEEIKDRVTLMNQTYNLGIRCLRSNIEIAEKPLKIAHFPPDNPRWFNKMKSILPEKLTKLLEKKFSRVLITGGRGFIASHLSGIKITENVEDKEALRPYFNTDYVIHTAVKTEGTERQVYNTNVIGTQNVIELCREYGVKMIYLNSIEERGIYGTTKQMAERMVRNSGIQAVSLRLPPIYTKEMLPAKRYYPMEQLVKDIEDIIKHHDFSQYEELNFIHQS